MKKVLLVSESRVFLHRNTKLLGRRGVKLFDTTKGEEALNLHTKHNFDLIISDFKLEGMDGVDLCALVSKSEQSQQVVTILACQNIKSHLELSEQCGASATLVKPIDPDKLLKTVGRFLDVQLGRRHRVELRVKVLCKDHNLEFFCRSRDISTTGILLETENQLELGGRLTCQFTLPTSSYIEAEGEVIRYTKEKDGSLYYGVTFIDIPAPSQREIFNYVNSVIVPDPIFHEIMSATNGAD